MENTFEIINLGPKSENNYNEDFDKIICFTIIESVKPDNVICCATYKGEILTKYSFKTFHEAEEFHYNNDNLELIKKYLKYNFNFIDNQDIVYYDLQLDYIDGHKGLKFLKYYFPNFYYLINPNVKNNFEDIRILVYKEFENYHLNVFNINNNKILILKTFDNIEKIKEHLLIDLSKNVNVSKNKEQLYFYCNFENNNVINDFNEFLYLTDYPGPNILIDKIKLKYLKEESQIKIENISILYIKEFVKNKEKFGEIKSATNTEKQMKINEITLFHEKPENPDLLKKGDVYLYCHDEYGNIKHLGIIIENEIRNSFNIDYDIKLNEFQEANENYIKQLYNVDNIKINYLENINNLNPHIKEKFDEIKSATNEKIKINENINTNIETKIYPEINGIYKHYKGGTYKVLFLSKHSENGEILVNYQSVTFGSYHSKPLEIWNEYYNDQPKYILKS